MNNIQSMAVDQETGLCWLENSVTYLQNNTTVLIIWEPATHGIPINVLWVFIITIKEVYMITCFRRTE